MKITPYSFCHIYNSVTPTLKCGRIEFVAEIQTHIHTGEDNKVMLYHETVDYDQVTLDGLKISDFRLLRANYASVGIDVDAEMDKVIQAYISDNFNSAPFINIATDTVIQMQQEDLTEDVVDNIQLDSVLENFKDQLNSTTVQHVRLEHLLNYERQYPQYRANLLLAFTQVN